MYGFIALPVCRSIGGRVKTKEERQRIRTESAWLCGPALPSWSRQTARCGVPGVSLGLLRPTRRARSNPGLLCFRRSVLRYVMMLSVKMPSSRCLEPRCLEPHGPDSCRPSHRRVAPARGAGMGARRRHEGGFRPFFEMCTWRCASVHGLGRIARGRHFADTGLDSCGGIKHLPRRSSGRPGRSVAVVPKDSAPNVAVVPKDSWPSAAWADGMVPSNVAVLPNDGADSTPPLPSPLWNRRRIGRESALRRIVRTSPFCQSMPSPGAFPPDPGLPSHTIT